VGETCRKTLRRILIVVLALAVVAMVYIGHQSAGAANVIVSRSHSADGAVQLTLLSSAHTIDQIFQSMQGPKSLHTPIKLSDSTSRHLVWLTGI
jgi:hypothetical protein